MASLIIRGVVGAGAEGASLRASTYQTFDISPGPSIGPCLVYNPSRNAKCCFREIIRLRKCIGRGHLSVCGNASAEAKRSVLHGAANTETEPFLNDGSLDSEYERSCSQWAEGNTLPPPSSKPLHSGNGMLGAAVMKTAEVNLGSSLANQIGPSAINQTQVRVSVRNTADGYEGSPIKVKSNTPMVLQRPQLQHPRRSRVLNILARDAELIQEGIKELRFPNRTEEMKASFVSSSLGDVDKKSPMQQDSEFLRRGVEFLNDLKDGLSRASKPFLKWGQRTGVDKILVRDLEVIQEWLSSMQKEIVPAIRMTGLEDSLALLEPPVPWPRPVYQGLSGKEIFWADREAVRAYVKYMRSLLNVWRIPLQLPYDRDAVASYFNHRPHILLFRFLEVSAAFAGVAVVYKASGNWEGSSGSGTENGIEEPALKYSVSLKRTLIKLGPTFVKVAQFLSSRPDVIGSHTAKVLSELQDRLSPFATNDAMNVIEEDLGVPVTEVFSYLSPDPVAAASFGQVYKGYTVEGEEVAVKVQRPDLLFNVARDIYILRLGGGFGLVGRMLLDCSLAVQLLLLKKLRNMTTDLSIVADELGNGLFGELDYTLEAANAQKFALLHRRVSYVKVPRTLLHLTRKRVLTMEWMHGDRPVDLQLIAKGLDHDGCPASLNRRQEAKLRLDALVRKGVECSLVQLLETGLMHADPHPGNLLYTSEGSLVYLDFGLLTHVDKKHRSAMLALIAHLVNGEWQCLANDFAAMDLLKPSTDLFALRLELERAFGEGPNPVVQNGKPDIQFGQLIGNIWKIAWKFRFTLPAYYSLVVRSLAALEGIAVSVDPDYKVFAAAYPYVVRRLLNDNSRPTRDVLQSLVLNQNREFRWDRIAAIMSVSRKASRESVLPGTADQLMKNLDGPQLNEVPGKKDLAPWLLSFALSKEGVSVRRVLLEADAKSLARAFAAASIAPFRRKLALLLADAFYRSALVLTNLRSGMMVPPGNNLTTDTKQASCSHLSDTDNNINGVDKNSPQLWIETRMKNRRLWFLLKVLMGRLRGSPVLLVRTAWTFVSMVGFAVAVALHRYVVTLSYQLLSWDSRTPLKRISPTIS